MALSFREGALQTNGKASICIQISVKEKKLVFLTSKSGTGDSKIYQTHNQWTSDGRWVIFRSDRVKGEAMAVNEETGDMVQVTEGGFTGMLCVARKSMNLYIMRVRKDKNDKRTGMEVVSCPEKRCF